MIENVLEAKLETKFFTPGEVAALLRRKPTTIWLWLRQRRLGYCRVGRSIVIPASELARFLEAGFIPALETAGAEV